jgi:hypothetical protein
MARVTKKFPNNQPTTVNDRLISPAHLWLSPPIRRFRESYWLDPNGVEPRNRASGTRFGPVIHKMNKKKERLKNIFFLQYPVNNSALNRVHWRFRTAAAHP